MYIFDGIHSRFTRDHVRPHQPASLQQGRQRVVQQLAFIYRLESEQASAHPANHISAWLGEREIPGIPVYDLGLPDIGRVSLR